MAFEYFRLAVGNLSQRRLRSVLTMIGIIIGIAAVIALISLGQGLQDAIVSQFSGLGSDRLIVSAKGSQFGPPGQNAAAMLTTDDRDTIAKSDYVSVAAGRLLKPATMHFDGQDKVVYVASFPDDNQEQRALIQEVTKPIAHEGRALDINDGNKAMLGNNWAKDNQFGDPIKPGQKIELGGVRFEVVGTLEKTGNPGFDGAIFLNEQPMRDALGYPDEYSVIVAKAESDALVPLAADAVQRDLRRARGVKEREEDFTVQTSEQLLSSITDILDVVQAVLIGIAAISLIVGGIGIMNTMYTSVLERTKDIGIMKAIGARNGTILLIFLLEAAILGIIGGAIGIALGAGFAKSVEAIASLILGPSILKASVSWQLIVAALVFSMGVGMVSGIVPAYQASKMEPVEALSK